MPHIGGLCYGVNTLLFVVTGTLNVCHMSTETIIIILVLVLLLGGGGFFFSRRR